MCFPMKLCVFVFMEYTFLISCVFSNPYDMRLINFARCKHLYVKCKLRNDDNDDDFILSLPSEKMANVKRN